MFKFKMKIYIILCVESISVYHTWAPPLLAKPKGHQCTRAWLRNRPPSLVTLAELASFLGCSSITRVTEIRWNMLKSPLESGVYFSTLWLEVAQCLWPTTCLPYPSNSFLPSRNHPVLFLSLADTPHCTHTRSLYSVQWESMIKKPTLSVGFLPPPVRLCVLIPNSHLDSSRLFLSTRYRPAFGLVRDTRRERGREKAQQCTPHHHRHISESRTQRSGVGCMCALYVEIRLLYCLSHVYFVSPPFLLI